MSRVNARHTWDQFISEDHLAQLGKFRAIVESIQRLPSQFSQNHDDRSSIAQSLHAFCRAIQETEPSEPTTALTATITNLIRTWPTQANKTQLSQLPDLNIQNKADYCATLLLSVFYRVLSLDKSLTNIPSMPEHFQFMENQCLTACTQYHQNQSILPATPVPTGPVIKRKSTLGAPTAALLARISLAQQPKPELDPTKKTSPAVKKAKSLLDAIDKYLTDGQQSASKKPGDNQARRECFQTLKTHFQNSVSQATITAFLNDQIYKFSAYKVAWLVGISTQDFSDHLQKIADALNEPKCPLMVDHFTDALKTPKSSANIAQPMRKM